MFLFAPCQAGAEKVLKMEIGRLYPEFRFAFSRPGFLTFKIPDDFCQPEERLDLIADITEQSIFARTASLSLGRIESSEPAEIVNEAWRVAEENRFFINRIHVFRRDPDIPGHRGFEPGLTMELIKLHRMLFEAAPKPKFLGIGNIDPDHPALLGETVLDLVQVEENQYFVGVHGVLDSCSIQAYYPGGVMPIRLPKDAVSRAWLKFEDGLRWAGLPIDKHSCCIDIGAAPGGGSQVLLARGAEVLGVDPGEMDPTVLKNPKFRHIRGRLNQTKRSIYRNARWLIADMNVAPSYTLNVLEDLVGRNDMKIRGMLFTLKLFQWDLVKTLPHCTERIRRWGFNEVRIKQLAFNRQEVMISAQKTARNSN